jgi:hypothetical protein
MSLIPQAFTDDQLLRYLLGALPRGEMDRLDELSVIDDELADRLRLLEDDLVDAYASGALTGEKLACFESFYLGSPLRQRKAELARSLKTTVNKLSQRRATVHQLNTTTRVMNKPGVPWSRAVAAVLVLTTGVLLSRTVSLRRELHLSEEQAAATTQQVQAITTELESQRQATAIAAQALADFRAARPAATVALVLRPETRGVGPTSIISIAPGSRVVLLDLQIGSADPELYEVTLKDPASNRVVWRSPALRAQRERHPPVISVAVPAAALLKSQHYALDVFELRRGSPPEFVASYAFEVTRP